MIATPNLSRSRFYPTIWRWHFYAGLLVLPFLITLSISGALYLFKPQIERWEERAFQNRSMESAVAPHRQVEAALAAHKGARFLDYRLPELSGDSAMVRLARDGGKTHEVFVAPDGQVLGTLEPDDRIMAVVKDIHSQLLIGKTGNRLVEMAASWAIVLIFSGIYLWWPRAQGFAGVLWPRPARCARVFWRDLHAVTGIWISGLALILLLTGLPWTDVWGNAFRTVRTEMGWVKGASPWAVDERKHEAASPHAAHDPHASPVGVPGSTESFSPAVFDTMVARARSERLAFPVVVTPPGAPGRFGAPGGAGWTGRADALNVPLQQTIRFDPEGQELLARERFEDSHVIDRVVGYGIAWHQGQLFGPINQAIGVVTAAGLITMAVSGFLMWRRRKPASTLGAPPSSGMPAATGPLIFIIVFGLVLPLAGLSLVAVVLLERLILIRIPAVREWLGLASITSLRRPPPEA